MYHNMTLFLIHTEWPAYTGILVFVYLGSNFASSAGSMHPAFQRTGEKRGDWYLKCHENNEACMAKTTKFKVKVNIEKESLNKAL